jgi:protein-L-isoaspartate(D-aspartate) O-methyltransferase
MDLYENFLDDAKSIHQKDNLLNLTYINDDGVQGNLDFAPYDVIVFTGGVPKEPLGLREQLKIGGKLFLFEGTETLMQANLIEKVGQNEYEYKSVFEDVIPFLVMKGKPSKFIF